MTTVYINPIIAACLRKAEQKLGAGTWLPVNEKQVELVEDLPDLHRLIEAIQPEMLASIGSTSADDINEFLAAHNLSIRLPAFGEQEFGAAAVLDILTRWQTPGAKTSILAEGRSSYHGIEMLADNFQVHLASDGSEVIHPRTGDGMTVMLTVAPDLATGLRSIRDAGPSSSEEFKGLRFPMIDYDAEVDISWAVGLRYVAESLPAEATLSRAVAQAKLRVNEVGAHAKAGAAIRVTRSSGGPRTITIDKPFVIAFMVGGQVAVAFHMTQEHWKQPSGLGGKGTPGNTW